MPELPEVESVRRSLAHAKLRQPLVKIWRSRKPLRTGKTWQQERLSLLKGSTPAAVHRRGKFIVWAFEPSTGEPLGLVVHLGMTGQLLVSPPNAPRAPHTHLILDFADGRQVRFVDPRRFGGLRAGLFDVLSESPPLVDLGPEPLASGFDGGVLEQAASKSRRVLRDVLLDQRVVAGVGNIYAVEALFVAQLHPLLAADRLDRSAWDRLAKAVQQVLHQGIRNGGTTFRDYRDAEGRAGRNQNALQVYGRAGMPCRSCGATLVGFVHGGRSGAYCPHDQARPRRRRVR